MTCDCCRKQHHESSLTLVRPDPTIGDPQPPQGGQLAFYCQAYMRARERFRRSLERGRKAYRRGRAA